MSTQSIRNIIRVSISRVLPMVKQKVREEGEKKLQEYIQKLQSPEEIKKMLESTIDSQSCDPEGRDKLHEKAEMLKEALDKIEKIILIGQEKIQELANKIQFLTDKIPIPPTAEDLGIDPTEKVNEIIGAIQPIINTLQKVIMVAPGILAASSGPAANGAIIANTNNSINLAKAKIEEYVNLFNSIPRLIDKYKQMAVSIVDNILTIQGYIQEVLDKINELRLFIIYLETSFENQCNNLFAEDTDNPPAVDGPPLVPPPLTVEDIILQFEAEYGDLLNSLILQGDQIAIRRVFMLGEDFQKIKNKMGNIKYTSIKKIDSGVPIWPPGGQGGIQTPG